MEEIDEDDTGDRITSSTVFLDDLSAPPMHHRTSSSSSVLPNGQQNAEAGPSRPRSASHASVNSQRSPTRSLSPVKVGDQPPKKKKFVRHDPYELPQLPKPSMHPSAVNDKPDERLLTDEELREYIEESKATHLDVTSPDFLALPPEVQYELTNDARVQSRAPNHRRTALMVQRSTNALEFSKAQIANLKVRNNLTQRMWGLAGVEGGLVAEGGRIAGEKGREYTLLKNETTGGWSLGVRNEGTEAKPIDLVEEEEFEGGDDGLGGEGRPRKKRRMIRGGVLVTLNSDGEEDEVQFHRMQPRVPRRRFVFPQPPSSLTHYVCPSCPVAGFNPSTETSPPKNVRSISTPSPLATRQPNQPRSESNPSSLHHHARRKLRPSLRSSPRRRRTAMTVRPWRRFGSSRMRTRICGRPSNSVLVLQRGRPLKQNSRIRSTRMTTTTTYKQPFSSVESPRLESISIRPIRSLYPREVSPNSN